MEHEKLREQVRKDYLADVGSSLPPAPFFIMQAFN